LRKQKQKQFELNYNELLEIDPEAAKELEEKMKKQSNTERMNLRHKKFGKWAKFASKSKNPSLNKELQDHYEKGKMLREKIKKIDESSSEDDDEIIDEDSSTSEELPSTGVMGMKFMQRALQKQKEEYKELKQQMMNEDNENLTENKQEIEIDEVQENIGRRVINKNNSKSNNLNKKEKLNISGKNHLIDEISLGSGFTTEMTDNGITTSTTEINESQSKISKESDIKSLTSKDNESEKQSVKSKDNKLSNKRVMTSKDDKKSNISNTWIQDTENIEIETKPKKTNNSKKQSTKSNPWMQVDTDKNDKTKGVKIDVEKLEEKIPNEGKEKSQFNLISHATEQQKELIKRAFANDDVEATFEQEKKDLIDEMIPEDLDDNKLPGWGSWGGVDIVPIVDKKKQKLKEEKRKKLEHKLLSERKDSHLKHVIINHKRDKKQTKYKTPDLPYPYHSKESYERSLSHPLGQEWNTNTVHKAIIKAKG